MASCSALAQPDPQWLVHDRDQPLPAVVEPGTCSSPDQPGRAPSDAIVLFDGRDLSNWSAIDGSPTQWTVRDSAMECVPGSGYVRTRRSFGDCQLHIEWATPAVNEGAGQGNGNSGVFFGLNRYEVQVLQSHDNATYADGGAGSVYGQYAPLVNASRGPGQWQSYDIIWTAPRFAADGTLLSKARITVLHNGVLVQNNVELTGPTAWIDRAPYSAHPAKLPISLQDHGNPVRFRNVWVRELDGGRPEYLLPDALLDAYAGDYRRGPRDAVKVRRASDGRLSVEFAGANLMLYATSATRFFAKTTDVRCEFRFTESEKLLMISVGQGEMRCQRIE